MLEIRCIECGWLDPKLWSCFTQCNCNHYFRLQVETPGRQLTLQVSLRKLPYHVWNGDYK